MSNNTSNINDYNNSLLQYLKPCTFNYKNEDPNKRRFGFIAQDLLKLFPEEEFTIVQKQPNGYYAVDYIQLIPLLVNHLKKQDERIAKLEKTLKCLNAPIEDF